MQEILRAAHKCRLDYVIITDHNTLLPREVLGEGWYGNVLLLFGQEISPEKNHYLALDLKKAVPPQADPQSYIKAVKEQGGIGFIAHPADRGNSFFQIPPYPWADYAVAGFDGIEIWNYFSDLGA
ncbi:MAG: histidinol-phosphatase, partial [bacterium]